MEKAVQQIRQFTLDTMKPEMAPWAKNYTPKMEDIQTRLRIISPDSKKCDGLMDYDKLFAERWAKRVLVKGRIGTGITMLGKKLAYDWAKGICVRFSIVLFVSMKLVNPTTPIENIIVQQYNKKGLSLSEQTMKDLLEWYGQKVLIIIDEFSDDPSQANKHCLKFLQKHREPDFTLLVTSGWFDTRELRDYIQLVCEIQGCTRAEQEMYFSCFPKANLNIKAVLDVEVDVPTMFCDSDRLNDLLIMFLCFIEDRKTEKLPASLLEIYLSVCASCFEGSIEKFLGNVKDIGKCAFDTLTKIMTIAEDSRLRPHVDAGILIPVGNCLVFPHDTIRIFFGALYFILMLDAGQNIDALVCSEFKEPIFLVDPLLLYFCLGLLGDQKYVPLSNRVRIYHNLKVYTQKLVDLVQMDLKDMQTMYPVFDHCCTEKTFDEIGFSFLSEVLSGCRNVRALILRPNPPHDRMWKQVLPYLGNLDIVVIAGHTLIQNDISDHRYYCVNFVDSPSGSERALNVLFDIDMEQVEYAVTFLDLLRVSNRHLVVRFNHNYMNPTMIDLAQFAQDNLKQLYFHHSVFEHQSFELFVDADVISCPQLTHLAFNDVHIEDVVLECLSRSVQEQKLPNLKSLSLVGSKEAVRGKIGLLFQSPWPKLTHFDVSKCQLDESDLKVICAATNSALENNLPNLTSLAISPDDVTEGSHDDLFVEPWMKLEALSFRNSPDSIIFKALHRDLFPSLKVLRITSNHGKVPLLKGISSLTCNVGMIKTQRLSKHLNHQTLFHLDLSFSQLSDGLKYIVRHKLPLLENLILRQCKLTFEDLQLLAEADQQSRLPKLQHLDVTNNDFCDVRHLIKGKWKKLKSLEFSWRTVSNRSNLPFLVEAFQAGSFGALEKLSLHTQSYYKTEQETCRTCRQIRQCRPREPFNCSQSMILGDIAESLDRVCFPSLRSVHVYDTHIFEDDAAAERQSIRKHGICVYITYYENPYVVDM